MKYRHHQGEICKCCYFSGTKAKKRAKRMMGRKARNHARTVCRTARQVRADLGWKPLSEAEQRDNLDTNLDEMSALRAHEARP